MTKTKKKKLPDVSKLYKKASTAMQNYYRQIGGACFGDGTGCTGRMEVIHHHFHWGQSVALRFEERNFVPLCHSCHCAFHKSGNHTIKTNYEREMRDAWGSDWEDQLLRIEQTHVKQSVPDKRDYLLNLIEYYEQTRPN